jgi:WD40 repeat protein
MAFEADGSLLATGSLDHTVTLWNISDLRQPTKLSTFGHRTSNLNSFALNRDRLAFSFDGKTLAAGTEGNVTLWDVSDPKSPVQAATLNGPLNDAPEYTDTYIAMSPTRALLAYGTTGHAVGLWNISDPSKPTKILTLTGPEWANAVAFSPDGNQLAWGERDNIILWDVSHPEAPVEVGRIQSGTHGYL